MAISIVCVRLECIIRMGMQVRYALGNMHVNVRGMLR